MLILGNPQDVLSCVIHRSATWSATPSEIWRSSNRFPIYTSLWWLTFREDPAFNIASWCFSRLLFFFVWSGYVTPSLVRYYSWKNFIFSSKNKKRNNQAIKGKNPFLVHISLISGCGCNGRYHRGRGECQQEWDCGSWCYINGGSQCPGARRSNKGAPWYWSCDPCNMPNSSNADGEKDYDIDYSSDADGENDFSIYYSSADADGDRLDRASAVVGQSSIPNNATDPYEDCIQRRGRWICK